MTRSQNDEYPTLGTASSGKIYVADEGTEANGTNTVTITNVAPAGVGTATISKWLVVTVDGDNKYYIPMWT